MTSHLLDRFGVFGRIFSAGKDRFGQLALLLGRGAKLFVSELKSAHPIGVSKALLNISIYLAGLSMTKQSAPIVRDTDADWRAIGISQPFWGVITNSIYLRENLNKNSIEKFYASGAEDISYIVAQLSGISNVAFEPGTALDFGCGAGRLSEGMTKYADKVFGYDISKGMLREAKINGGGKVSYTDVLPDGPFDWINSRIVFQHIPPDRGYRIFEDLLSRLAPFGLISLHFPIYRDDGMAGPLSASEVAEQGVGTVMMFDYDLVRVIKLLNMSNIHNMKLVHEDHGGHHTIAIYARGEGSA